MNVSVPEAPESAHSLRDLAFYFLRLGTVGFGGPIALVGRMERDLVGERRWLQQEQYKRGLALAQLAPGPLAAQLAMYIGYLNGKAWGATIVGIAFILPSFLMVIALGMLYVSYGGLPWMQAAFYGIGAGVIGIIVKSASTLARRSLGKVPLLWGIFALMCLATAWTEEESVSLFLLSGIVTMLIRVPPKPSSMSSLQMYFPPVALLVLQAPAIAQSDLLLDIFLFFARAGTFVFGSGLAIVPFLHGGVVQQHHWLNEKQFLDAVAVAMITPGPVVITVGFIGYLVDALPGALAAALGVFLPVYLFVVIPAPYVERYAHNARLVAFIEGVTAAATGAIAGAVVVLGTRAIVDIPTAAIALATLLVMIRFKIPEPAVIAAAGAIGFLIRS
jgi:chromate transporter